MQPLTWEELLSLESPWAYVVTCSESELDNFALRRQTFSPGAEVVRFIRGVRCATKSAVFQEWAAAYQFPWYFGENWDAFHECVRDLEWLPGTSYVCFLTNAHHLLAREPGDFDTFVDLLKDTAGEWISGGDSYTGPRRRVPFKVVFQSISADFSRRLGEAGADVVQRALPSL
jgi:hypothetical protein